MPELFGIPTYKVYPRYLGELHKSTTERYMERFMRAKGIESIAPELREGRLIGHVESVVSSSEA